MVRNTLQNELITFLVEAKKNGYASDIPPVKEADGSLSNRFARGDWSFHDNWFGGEPFGGREVVFYQDRPYWMMAYYGSDTQAATDTIAVLRKALSQMPEDMPVRGPKELVDGDYVYKNNWQGNLEKFSGQEVISFNEKEVYRAWYAGGLVDKRGE